MYIVREDEYLEMKKIPFKFMYSLSECMIMLREQHIANSPVGAYKVSQMPQIICSYRQDGLPMQRSASSVQSEESPFALNDCRISLAQLNAADIDSRERKDAETKGMSNSRVEAFSSAGGRVIGRPGIESA